jgi:indole-3-glycerol phosphate synthase
MFLPEIIQYKRREVTERTAHVSLDEMRSRADRAGAPRAFAHNGSMALIAEVKRRSPSKGALVPALDPVAQAQAYQCGGAMAISVLTDAHHFGGSFEDLSAIRAAVDVPVLCKDFILTPYQAYEARAHGADLVLLIVAALDDQALIELQQVVIGLGMTPLVEVHDQHDLARALAAEASVIGINNRDLNDFSVDLVTTEYLAPLIPDDVMAISESGIGTRQDVQRVALAGARAVLVGEALMRSPDPAATIRELLGR